MISLGIFVSTDHICDESVSTHELFERVAKPIALSAVDGFNGTIFAYGQTSSGAFQRQSKQFTVWIFFWVMFSSELHIMMHANQN